MCCAILSIERKDTLLTSVSLLEFPCTDLGRDAVGLKSKFYESQLALDIKDLEKISISLTHVYLRQWQDCA